MTGRTGRRDPVPAGAHGPRPMVAIVGRPNVGKSTLFNRLAGRRIAIVEDQPGVTRDRHYADADAYGREYVLIDTGGFDPDSEDPMAASIASQVELAIDEADIILCVLDATTDPTPADRQAVQLLRQSDKRVLYLANKADSEKRAALALNHYELGIDEILPISAQHGRQMGELEEAIAHALPEIGMHHGEEQPEYRSAKRIAIVGRPNAGKSSFVNRLLGEPRLVVDDRPGTTVDSVDTFIHRNDKPLVLIDTAGMRKKRRVRKVRGIEGLAVIHAIRSLERSHGALLLIDADEGVGEQDLKIAALADQRGRALVIGLNKMDCLAKDEEARKAVFTRARERFRGVSWAPIHSLSVKTGRGVQKVMTALDAALEEHNKRIPTGELNRFFEEVLEKHPPPAAGGKSVRLFYVTQAEVRPPTFVVMTNLPDDVHLSYRRYVENQIRVRFGFEGTSIRVRWRARRKADLDAV